MSGRRVGRVLDFRRHATKVQDLAHDVQVAALHGPVTLDRWATECELTG